MKNTYETLAEMTTVKEVLAVIELNSSMIGNKVSGYKSSYEDGAEIVLNFVKDNAKDFASDIAEKALRFGNMSDKQAYKVAITVINMKSEFISYLESLQNTASENIEVAETQTQKYISNVINSVTTDNEDAKEIIEKMAIAFKDNCESLDLAKEFANSIVEAFLLVEKLQLDVELEYNAEINHRNVKICDCNTSNYYKFTSVGVNEAKMIEELQGL